MPVPHTVVAQTEYGAVRGTVADGHVSFLGIRYAAAPTGPLRWRAPQPPQRWPGIADATAFGPVCPQPPGFAVQAGPADEDCLRLNIFSPDPGRRDLPVMVWLHGGGFVWGSAAEYIPAAPLAERAVVVTVGYRLGVLGFLAHPDLTAEQPHTGSGNYALLDVFAALGWISRNITAFGGDPRAVTLFGQSSGASLVGAALAAPQGSGLFHRAIMQGATCAYPMPDLHQEQDRGLRLARQIGDLRRIPAAELVPAVTERGFTAWGLVHGGGLLPLPLTAAFGSGAVNRVPVLQGTNRHDMRLEAAIAVYLQRRLKSPQAYVDTVTHEFGPSAAGQITETYPVGEHGTPALAYAAAATDGLLACPARTVAGLLSSWMPVYCYEFADPDAPRLVPIPRTFPLGAYHGAELPSLFRMRTSPAILSEAQLRLSEQMASYWSTFASSGDPNGESSPCWPRYEPGSGYVMSLLPEGCHLMTDFAEAHRCKFWDGLSWTAPRR